MARFNREAIVKLEQATSRLRPFGSLVDPEASRYFLPEGYRHRPSPHYFEDMPSGTVIHQPDVYAIAAHLARGHGCSHIIDLGCGQARKLVALHPDFRTVGLDVGANLEHCRRAYPFGRWIEVDLEQPVPRLDPEILRDAVIVSSDVIEHLRDPTHVLRFLHDALEQSPLAVLSTPDRALVRGPDDLGPPQNPAHVREWTLDEFRRLLDWAGLPTGFTGLTVNNSEALLKHTILALIDPMNSEAPAAAPVDFRVIAVVATFNEVDVIDVAVEDLFEQGVDVYILDNWSSDGTYERLRDRFAGRLIGLERFPASGPTDTYDWEGILRRKEQIAKGLPADWLIHADPDEIRRSPWPGVSLRDALAHVDRQGFNLIDQTVIEFRPTDDSFVPGCDHRRHFDRFELCTRPGCFLQQRIWKAAPGWSDLASEGGHRVQIPGARVFPYKFLLMHYPIRSQTQGERKIFVERQPRIRPGSGRQASWHTHLRDLKPGHPMLWSTDTLARFDPADFAVRYLGERLTGVGIIHSAV